MTKRTCDARIADYTDNYRCGALAGSHGLCPKHFAEEEKHLREKVSSYADRYTAAHNEYVKLIEAEAKDREASRAPGQAGLPRTGSGAVGPSIASSEAGAGVGAAEAPSDFRTDEHGRRRRMR